MRFLALFVAAVLCLGAAKAPLALSVTPAHAFEPANIVTTIRVPKDAKNRWLRVVINCETGQFRAKELEGIDILETNRIEWRGVPGCNDPEHAYEVVVALVRDGEGAQESRARFVVLPRNYSEDPP